MINLHIDLDGIDTRKNPDEEIEDDAEDGNSREHRETSLYFVVHEKLHSKLSKKYFLPGYYSVFPNSIEQVTFKLTIFIMGNDCLSLLQKNHNFQHKLPVRIVE